jgi:hypothetical protein
MKVDAGGLSHRVTQTWNYIERRGEILESSLLQDSRQVRGGADLCI